MYFVNIFDFRTRTCATQTTNAWDFDELVYFHLNRYPWKRLLNETRGIL